VYVTCGLFRGYTQFCSVCYKDFYSSFVHVAVLEYMFREYSLAFVTWIHAILQCMIERCIQFFCVCYSCLAYVTRICTVLKCMLQFFSVCLEDVYSSIVYVTFFWCMFGGYIQLFSVLLLVYVTCGLCKGYIQFFIYTSLAIDAWLFDGINRALLHCLLS